MKKVKNWLLMQLFAKHRAFTYDWQDGRGAIEYTHRYDGSDYTMSRPIHPQMSVAPPSAEMIFKP